LTVDVDEIAHNRCLKNRIEMGFSADRGVAQKVSGAVSLFL
jgi:hypothetical protein